jgi:phosphinothricin acetyltransferase
MPTLRDATDTDATAIAAIYNQSIGARDSTMQLEPISAKTVRSWIAELGAREVLLVLERGDAIAGWGTLRRYSPRAGYRYAGETSVYLDRNQTGQGWGAQVQAALIERARSLDYHHLVAKVWADNARSVALHRKFGYDRVGVQREIGRVDGVWRDVAILQKVLPTAPE